MGGAIEKEKLHDFSWELHISEIEYELKSNVVPIGKVKKGTFYHRALLFKVHEHLFYNTELFQLNVYYKLKYTCISII